MVGVKTSELLSKQERCSTQTAADRAGQESGPRN